MSAAAVPVVRWPRRPAYDAADLAAALLGSGPRLGIRRFPVRVGSTEVRVYGLARGGSALIRIGGATLLDEEGNLFDIPGGAVLAEAFLRAGVEFRAHEV